MVSLGLAGEQQPGAGRGGDVHSTYQTGEKEKRGKKKKKNEKTTGPGCGEGRAPRPEGFHRAGRLEPEQEPTSTSTPPHHTGTHGGGWEPEDRQMPLPRKDPRTRGTIPSLHIRCLPRLPRAKPTSPLPCLPQHSCYVGPNGFTDTVMANCSVQPPA